MSRCGLEVGTTACQVGVEPIPRSRADRPFSLDWWAIVPIHQKVLHCLEIEGMGKLEAIPTVLHCLEINGQGNTLLKNSRKEKSIGIK
jgi:hypothetical protein